MADLFSTASSKGGYNASDIEVLEGLEPVRRRPGMYIGGTDERALHHLVGEILDNPDRWTRPSRVSADRIELTLHDDGSVRGITDNGRGIPVDNHPKFPGKSALEVIFTTLHSGGKFSGKNYETSGGLHGVGSSVVNALSDWMWVEVARDKQLYKQSFSRGKPTSKLKKEGSAGGRRGTTVCFHADPEIFGTKAHFKPAWLYQMARSKAYLYGGVEIKWHCESKVYDGKTPNDETFRFPNGLMDFLHAELADQATLTPAPFAGNANLPDKAGRVEFAIAWTEESEGFVHTYCNTIPTPQGGTHEQGMRTALARGLRAYAEMTGNKKTSLVTADDVTGSAAMLLSVFIRDPQFQGQTKEKLASAEVTRWVDVTIKDHFDHWLSGDPAASKKLLEFLIDRAEERRRRDEDKKLSRKSATRKLRLPGKLSDCSRSEAEGTELFIVEGDSAGGSAKTARDRETQAILPLRGKILNVVSATADKMRANQEIQDLILALGCGAGKDFNLDALRYEKIIIMTDADVDGAHIASLLITFFYTQMKALIETGRLYLAQPPLYRLVSGNLSEYARDDAHKEELMNTTFKGKGKVDISRFKGLGEMPAKQLKETTMNIESRILIRVTLPHVLESMGIVGEGVVSEIDDLVERLMGRNADARFQFIQERAEFVQDIDI